MYYAMSMMLAALFPERSATIHEVPLRAWNGSPVFQALRRLYPSEAQFKRKIADWFFGGMTLPEATRILNRFAQQRDPSSGQHFHRWPVRARRIARLKRSVSLVRIAQIRTVNDVIDSLCMHLPVIIAGGGIGSHAVLAMGCQTSGASDRYICIHDPGKVHVEWKPVGELFVADAEVIMPNWGMFQEYRPAKVVTSYDESQFVQWSKENLK